MFGVTVLQIRFSFEDDIFELSKIFALKYSGS